MMDVMYCVTRFQRLIFHTAATAARRTWTKTRFKTRGLHRNGMVEIGRIQSEIPQIPQKKSVEMGTDVVGMPKDGITQEQWESCWDAVCYAFGKLSTKSMCKC